MQLKGIQSGKVQDPTKLKENRREHLKTHQPSP